MEGRHEQLLEFSMVARGDPEVVLAEYSPFSSASSASLAALASRTSSLVSSHARDSNSMLSYTSDHHTFHFLIQDHFRFVVVSNHSTEKKIAFTYLQRIKDNFFKSYGDASTNSDSSLLTTPNGIAKEFGPKLQEHMEYCLDHFQTLQKLPSIRDQVQDIQENIMENIKQVHENQIYLQIDEVEVIQAQAENFKRQGNKLKRKMWMQQARIKLAAIAICLLTILIIWIAICKGLTCS